MAGELVAEGAVLGSQAGVLGAGGIEPLAERVGGCAVRGSPAGGWWLECLLAVDEVADLVLAVEPSPGDAADCATVLKFTACPWRCSSWMAWRAASSAAWWRRSLAWAR